MEKKIYFNVPCEDGILKISQDAVISLVRNVVNESEGMSEAAVIESFDRTVWADSKGILVSKGEAEGSCRIKVYITVALGCPMTEKAAELQNAVKAAVEDVASIKAESVDVLISGVSFAK